MEPLSVPLQKPRSWSRTSWLPMTGFRVLRRAFGRRATTGWRDRLLTGLWSSVGHAGRADPELPAPPVPLPSETGLLVTSVDALGLTGFAALQEHGETTAAGIDKEAFVANSGLGKKYKIPLNGDMYANPADSPLTRWALQPQLLAIARDYLGVPVRVHSTEMHLDMPIGGDPVASQFWHHDGLDHKLVKVFTYLRDVTPETGHLMAISMDASRRHRWELTRHPRFSERAPERNRLVSEVVPDSEVASLTGPAGTVIIADTATLLHRGAPQVSASRMMFVVTYTSVLPFEEWPPTPWATLSDRPSRP